jgi:hypothetical protein
LLKGESWKICNKKCDKACTDLKKDRKEGNNFMQQSKPKKNKA